MNLSKSQYIKGLKCPKSLWLYKNRPASRKTLDEKHKSLFNIENFIQKLFLDGVKIEFNSSNFEAMINKTKLEW